MRMNKFHGCHSSAVRLLGFAAALLGLTIGVAASHAATIDFLPLGDSITAQGLYIAPLKSLLSNAGYTPTEIANEGFSGYTIAHQYTINGVVYTSPRSGLLETLSGPTGSLSDPRVNSTNTDILLMIGTNNVDTGFDLADYDVQYRMDLLISTIGSLAPKAQLIVAQIIPNCRSVASNQAVQNFNIDVGAAVAIARATWPNVSLVNMYPPFNPTLYSPYTPTQSPYMTDILHPDQQGGNLMAQVWYNGIVAVGAAPALGNSVTWTLATTGDWSVAANWNGGALPTSSDTATCRQRRNRDHHADGRNVQRPVARQQRRQRDGAIE